jgi:hypothetical protein
MVVFSRSKFERAELLPFRNDDHFVGAFGALSAPTQHANQSDAIFNTYRPRMHPNDGRVVSNFVIRRCLAMTSRFMAMAHRPARSVTWMI